MKRIFSAFILMLSSSCVSTSDDRKHVDDLMYGGCDVTELRDEVRKLAAVRYPNSNQEGRSLAFRDIGDRLRFYFRLPKTYVGGSPTAEFDKNTCELVRFYHSE